MSIRTMILLAEERRILLQDYIKVSAMMPKPLAHSEAKDAGPTETGCTTSEAIDVLHAAMRAQDE